MQSSRLLLALASVIEVVILPTRLDEVNAVAATVIWGQLG
jgi:hypothetical protein